MAGVGCHTTAKGAGRGGMDKSTAPPVTEGLFTFNPYRDRHIRSKPSFRRSLVASGLVVGWHQHGIGQFLVDNQAHLPDPRQVRIYTFSLLVEDPLPVGEDFHDALPPGRDGYCNVRSIVPEKLVRHPRGGSEVLSTNAVGDLYLDFPFHEQYSLSLK